MIVSDCDSLLSLELGRPATIKEEDCDVELPNPISDDFINEELRWIGSPQDMTRTALLPTAHVVGPIARLLRLLNGPQIAVDTLRTYDLHFDQIMQRLPALHQSHTDGYAEVTESMPFYYLQNARLMLHRHNLTPRCDQQSRAQAIRACADVAKVTATLLRRSMQDPPSSETVDPSQDHNSWEKRLVAGASAFLCTHVWRCTLFLLFQLEFDAASTCTRASAVLGNARPINMACGRYLEFVLGQMIVKLRDHINLDTDEELLAYISGDQQGSFQNSWIWHDHNDGLQLDDRLQDEANGHVSRNHVPCSETDFEATERSEWAGWDRIPKLILGLAEEHKRVKDSESLPLDERAPSSPVHLPSLAAVSETSVPAARERLSIKDLL